ASSCRTTLENRRSILLSQGIGRGQWAASPRQYRVRACSWQEFGSSFQVSLRVDPVAATISDAGTRRDFLYVASGAVGAVGVTAAAWPFIDQMNPSTATL